MTRRRTSDMMPLRVGFMTPGFGLGGAERWVISLMKRFSGAVKVSGVLAHVGADNQPLYGEAAKITNVYLDDAEPFLSGCDAVIAWGWPALADTLQGWQGRCVAVSHGTPALPWSILAADKMASHPGVKLAAVSKAAALVWPGRDDVTVIPNGVEFDRLTPRDGRDRTRAKLGINAGERVALYLGRNSEEKRPWLFADAVRELGSGWRGVMSGGGIGNYCNDMICLDGVPHVGDLLAAADVMVMPSQTEAHPIALTEAWAAGVPTVYMDWEFAAQIRDDVGSDLGVVVPVDAAPSQIAEAIVASDGVDTGQARDAAWSRFSASMMAASWERLILDRF